MCDHQCSSSCRRKGCHCECGEFHEDKNNRAFSTEQLAQIAQFEKEAEGFDGI